MYASIRNYFLPPTIMEGVNVGVTQYNNYIIFVNSFNHLIHNQDLYCSFPNEQYDLFKYTPTAALFFGIFKVFPHSIGLVLWNILNVLLPILALVQLININRKLLFGLCFWMIPEMVTTTLNSQCNSLILGLLLWFLVFIQRDRPFWAALCLSFTIYLKLFCIVFLLFLLVIPSKRWKYIYFGIITFLGLGILPLIFISMGQYLNLFKFLWQFAMIPVQHCQVLP